MSSATSASDVEETGAASRPPRVFLTEEDELDDILQRKLTEAQSRKGPAPSPRRSASASNSPVVSRRGSGSSRDTTPHADRRRPGDLSNSPTSNSPVPRRGRKPSFTNAPAGATGAPSPSTSCCSPRCVEYMYGTLLLLAVLGIWIMLYRLESLRVCNLIAYAAMYNHVAVPECTHDRRFDGRLVYLHCPLYYRGATDPGTGLHTVGYSLKIQSLQLQHQARYYYPKTVGNSNPDSQNRLRQPPCICFEKVWTNKYIELGEDIEYSPRLCSRLAIYPGSYCDPWYPGPNPRMEEPTPGEPQTALNSLGDFSSFSDRVFMGRYGVELSRESIEDIGWEEDEDLINPSWEPLYFLPQSQRGGDRKWTPHSIPHQVLDGRFERLQGWEFLDCNANEREYFGLSNYRYYLYKPTDRVYTRVHDNDGRRFWVQRWVDTEVVNASYSNCRRQHAVGDRILSITARGVDDVVAIGLQNGNFRDGTSAILESYPLHYDSTFCKYSNAEIQYVGIADDEHPRSLHEIWESYEGNDEFTEALAIVRFLSFLGCLIAFVVHSLLVRKLAAPPPESYRGALAALPTCRLLLYSCSVALAVFLAPLILCSAGVLPENFLRLVGVAVAASVIARCLLLCGYRTARERIEQLGEQRNSADSSNKVGAPATSVEGSSERLPRPTGHSDTSGATALV